MTWVVPSATATLVGTLILTFVYWYMFRQYRDRFLGLWTLSWALYAIRFVFEILLQLSPDRVILVIGHQFTNLASGLMLLWGTLVFLDKNINKWIWAGFVLDAVWITAGVSFGFSWLLLNLPTFVFMGLIYIWTGTTILRSGKIDGIGKQMTGWGFIIWGFHKLDYPYIRVLDWLAPLGYLTAAVLEFMVASGTLLVYFERMKNVLNAGEERFRMMAENAQDIIYRYRLLPERGFEYVSPSVSAIVGYTPEEHYADPDIIFKIVHPDDIKYLSDLKVLTGVSKIPMVIRSLNKDGKVVWTEHRNVPIYDSTGSIVGFEGIARDITEQKQVQTALQESESRFRNMLEAVRMIAVSVDSEGKIVFCNDFLLQLTGWERNEIIDRNWFDIFHPPEQRENSRQVFLERISEGSDSKAFCSEQEIVTRQGERRLISWKSTVMPNSEGSPASITCFGEDISERRRAEEVFKRYQLICRHASDIILFFTREGQIIEINDAAVKTYGYSRKEMLSKKVHDLRAPESKALLAEKIKQAETKGLLYETMHTRKDGSTFPVEVSLQGTVFDNERVLVGIVRDISDRKRAEETINHLAYHDPLTDLPNRILFYDRLRVAIAHANRNKEMLALMFLDLDRFKFVNDMMGHAMGDQLLKDVARNLKDCIRANDTVARMGGDEFTILLPAIGREEDAARIAQKINDSMKKPWEVNGYEFHITASIGIVLYPNDGQDADTLTKNADTAMYRAKEQGDNYQFYTPAMNVKALERMEIAHSLRKALELTEFEVYYQPQVNIRNGKITGTEALVRWHHPEKGLILPTEFIPVAEDTGLIISIGEWVLRTACTQNMAWQKAGYPPMRTAVNLSACQFRQKTLVDSIARILNETGMDPRLLELEITETTAMQDVDLSISVMRSLREMGIGIAMDDFGTGYSSLSYLRKFPVTTLKIDRSFVREVLSDCEDAAIVATIIVMAQNLKLKVIVEGVENEEQLVFFEQQECFEMQGFLFSKPEPAGIIDEMLKRAVPVTGEFVNLA